VKGEVPRVVREDRRQLERDGESVARLFHETYERLAPAFGYETRKDTKVFDANSKNGRLMIAVCESVLKRLESSEGERADDGPVGYCKEPNCDGH
jgi:hypothetical protein